MLRFSLIFLFAGVLGGGPLAVAADFDESRGESREEGRNDAEQRKDRGVAVPQDRAGSSGAGDAESENRNGRRNSRLSPEERRALRRQIDEAGNDIYRRRR